MFSVLELRQYWWKSVNTLLISPVLSLLGLQEPLVKRSCCPVAHTCWEQSPVDCQGPGCPLVLEACAQNCIVNKVRTR